MLVREQLCGGGIFESRSWEGQDFSGAVYMHSYFLALLASAVMTLLLNAKSLKRSG